MTKASTELTAALDYQFNNVALLTQALTHRSIKSSNNERLEFLGDSILNFLIAEALFDRYPDYPEGLLSRYRANLVNRNTLSQLANEFHLADFIKMAPSELRAGSQYRASILSDTLEAVIAAIYLDSDYVTCQKKIQSWYQKRIESLVTKPSGKDAKSVLQEYCQAKKMAMPTYDIIEIKGSQHCQIFHIRCSVTFSDSFAIGTGLSRRIAEQLAAKKLLQELSIHHE